MFPVFEATQVRSDYTADGTLIGGAISVPSDIFEYGTNIKAGATADAPQGVALFGVGEQAGAVIVEQHNVHFERAITLVVLSGTSQLRIVAGEVLASSGCCQHGEHQCQVFQFGDNFLNPHQCNMNFGKRSR